MAESSEPTEPQRPADIARLALLRLRVEDGVTLDAVFHQLTEAAAEVLDVARVGVWLLVNHGRSLRCVDLFERAKKEHATGSTLQVSDFPEYFAALGRRRTLPAELAAADPRTDRLAEAYLAPLGITSLLDAPVFLGGELIGVVCHEHIGPPREWTTEDRDFAGSMADLVALKVRAAELRDARVALIDQQEQLAEARRLDSLTAMAAGVAHDFNNILAVVLSAADMIARDPRAETVTELARQIREAGERGVSLSQELMSFARPGPTSTRVVCPAEVVSLQLPMLQRMVGSGHPITLDLRSTTGRVLISPDQLERVVLNLVLNARDAMPDGGPIGVTVDTTHDQDDNGLPRRSVLVAVSDVGTGIPADVLPQIFDPFFTTKPRGSGTGLGLAVVHQIVNHAGGFIRVETELGHGTSFRVHLPRVGSSL